MIGHTPRDPPLPERSASPNHFHLDLWRAVKETGSPARWIHPMFRARCVAIDVGGLRRCAVEPRYGGWAPFDRPYFLRNMGWGGARGRAPLLHCAPGDRGGRGCGAALRSGSGGGSEVRSRSDLLRYLAAAGAVRRSPSGEAKPPRALSSGRAQAPRPPRWAAAGARKSGTGIGQAARAQVVQARVSGNTSRRSKGMAPPHALHAP